MLRAVLLRISGRVQGVGYRAWFADEARARGLVGWVRNRADGSVEACIAGNDSALTQMIDAARSGPSHARVDKVDVTGADSKGLDGLRILPTL
ncbi:acylphosphatase [Roseiterribacter gracilis]|uniref:acylphosphatase n=1 Tax=Roseiterribacter gracilis TaxID=2812848 RepID=A0A8S8XF66_9PROT|nr:acylphosphatase [Rhodospirillales bacterium TMPK1]